MILDNFRFTCNDGVADTVVVPHISGFKRVWERQDNTRFYRDRISGDFLFRGAYYDYFKAIYDAGGCSPLTITIEQNCGGTWSEYYVGKILTAEGSYDFDRCEVTFEIAANDAYECVNREINVKRNWIAFADSQPVTCKTRIGTIETTTCNYTGAPIGSPFAPLYYKACWSGTATQTNRNADPALAWRPYDHTQSFDGGTSIQTITTIWARETITQVAMPPGFGWINLGSNKWVRPITYTNVSQSSYVDGTNPVIEFSAESADVEISNGRTLQSVIEGAVFAMNCDIDEVVSNFFDINTDATNPTNDAYDFAAERMQDVLMFQKSDIVNENASNDATRLEMSLNDFFQEIMNGLNLFWAIRDVSGVSTLYIEHETYFAGANGLNLVTLEGGKYVVGTNRFTLREKTPAYEQFAYNEAFIDNFLPCRVVYDCGGESVEDKSLKLMSNDVGGLLNNAAAGLTGFCLVSTVLVSGTQYLCDNYGDDLNGAFSWAALMPNVWAFGRYNADGFSTIGDINIQTVKKRREQTPVTIPFCCDDTFSPDETVNTGLGWGDVKTAEYDARTAKLTLNLLQ